MRSLLCLLIVIAGGLLAVRSAAAQAPVPMTQLGVDQVALKRGPKLLGTVLNRAADGTVELAVLREWLRATHARYYATCVDRERASREAALNKLRGRLADWIQQRAGDEELLFFLKKEDERLRKVLASGDAPRDADESEFLLLTIPTADVDRVFVQPVVRKQVAALAWRERLTDVEQRSVNNLQRELQKRNLDPARDKVDLSDRLPVREQSDAEWGARQALIEYQYRQPFDFQGTWEAVVRTGVGAAPQGAGALLVDALKGPLTGALNDLLGEGPSPKARPNGEQWMQTASRQAESGSARGWRATRVAPDPVAQRVVVEARFVARLPSGTWETIWSHTETLDATKPNEELTKRIAHDPQVKQVLEIFQGAGLGTGEPQIQQALRLGAATMQAQEAADGKFFEFRDRYLKRVEGPPLLLPRETGAGAPARPGAKNRS
ncbi:MAG: hypothetical protein ACKV0T_16300 [Planctomycetales bacterium]